MRSLNADSFRPSLLKMVAAVLLLGMWLAWFIFARVTLYETSTDIRILETDGVAAYFPAEKAQQLRGGQLALMRLDDVGSGRPQTIPAIIMKVERFPETNQVRVDLFPLWDDTLGDVLGQNLPVQVNVEVERVSPALLALRAAGQLLDPVPIFISPQQR